LTENGAFLQRKPEENENIKHPKEKNCIITKC